MEKDGITRVYAQVPFMGQSYERYPVDRKRERSAHGDTASISSRGDILLIFTRGAGEVKYSVSPANKDTALPDGVPKDLTFKFEGAARYDTNGMLGRIVKELHRRVGKTGLTILTSYG